MCALHPVYPSVALQKFRSHSPRALSVAHRSAPINMQLELMKVHSGSLRLVSTCASSWSGRLPFSSPAAAAAALSLPLMVWGGGACRSRGSAACGSGTAAACRPSCTSWTPRTSRCPPLPRTPTPSPDTLPRPAAASVTAPLVLQHHCSTCRCNCGVYLVHALRFHWYGHELTSYPYFQFTVAEPVEACVEDCSDASHTLDDMHPHCLSKLMPTHAPTGAVLPTSTGLSTFCTSARKADIPTFRTEIPASADWQAPAY